MLAVDIGSDSVKLLQTRRGRVVRLEEALARGDGAVAALQRLFQGRDVRREAIWTTIQGSAVITHVADFPDLPPQEMRSAVELEADGFISRDLSEMDVDYAVLTHLANGQRRVLVAAVPKHLTDERVDLLQAAGVGCAGVSVDVVALTNAFEAGAPEIYREGEALLLDIGGTTTNMVLVDQGEPILLRGLAFGGRSVTEAIMRNLGVSFDEAERAQTSGDGEELASVGKAGAEPLLEEISTTLGYQARRRDQESAPTVYLTGGGSLSSHLVDRIREEVDAAVEFFDPFARLKLGRGVSTEGLSSARFAVAVGCALGEERA